MCCVVCEPPYIKDMSSAVCDNSCRKIMLSITQTYPCRLYASARSMRKEARLSSVCDTQRPKQTWFTTIDMPYSCALDLWARHVEGTEAPKFGCREHSKAQLSAPSFVLKTWTKRIHQGCSLGFPTAQPPILGPPGRPH